MRILFLSNYYPPQSRGGYEQWCQEVAVELARRGHHLTVLTCHGQPETGEDQGVQVHRLLNLEVEGGLVQTVFKLLVTRCRLENNNLRHLRWLADTFQPDVTLIWGMWNVPRAVPALAELLWPHRVAYYICDYWLSLPNAYIQRWQEDARKSLTQLPKTVLKQIFLPGLLKVTPKNLQLEHPICVSRAVRNLLVEAHVPVSHARIIYGGTQVEDFIAAAQTRSPHIAGPLQLVYIGRLEAEKGVHTIINALSLLIGQGHKIATLHIYGKGNPDYEAGLKAQVAQNRLIGVVEFKGSVPRTKIPDVLARYDALIFSSEWPEPFARTVLEAMATGLVVIGTTTGGTGEILLDGITGLTYTKGDSMMLADKIKQLAGNPFLQKKIAGTGQQRVLENFRFLRMVDEIENVFYQISANNAGKAGVL